LLPASNSAGNATRYLQFLTVSGVWILDAVSGWASHKLVTWLIFPTQIGTSRQCDPLTGQPVMNQFCVAHFACCALLVREVERVSTQQIIILIDVGVDYHVLIESAFYLSG
jgi:hypothetical protein